MTNFIPENLKSWSAEATPFDSAANYVGDDFEEFYLAPVSINRNTEDCVTLSNWQVIRKELDELIEHEESGVSRFGHWAVGWYELYLIHKSDKAALECADEWAATLLDYPVACGDHLSELEYEAEIEAWDNYGEHEWRKILSEHLAEFAPSDPVEQSRYGFKAAEYWADEIVDKLSGAVVYELWHELTEHCGWSCYHLDDGPNFNFKDPAEMLTAEVLSKLVGLPLLSPEQAWRREPYQWVDGTSSPLAPTLPLYSEVA
jgi:hypothetical protein